MEFLKELFTEPLTFEAFQKAVEERGMKPADLSQGKYVDKEKYESLKADFEAQKQGQARLLEQQAERVEAEYAKKEQALLDALAQEQQTGAMNLALQKLGAKNNKAVMALMDLDQVVLKDGVLDGFYEQVEAIRSENGYLFSQPASTGLPQGSAAVARDAFVDAARSAAGLKGN